MLDKNDILVDSYDNSSRQIPNINKKIDAKSSFKDAHLPLTEEQVKKKLHDVLAAVHPLLTKISA